MLRERNVEGLAFDVERLGAVHGELHLVHLAVREGRPGGSDPLGIRIERVDAPRPRSGKRGEAAVAAADLEDAGAVERDECLDPPRLGAVQVRIVHA